MFDNSIKHVDGNSDDRTPKPWEQLPQEPPDHFGWFQIYLTLPVPRHLVRVAQIVGMNPRSSWISKIARKWRWIERAEALDAERAQRLVVQSELRNRLLKDVAFKAQFQGLHDTNRALGSAAIGEMDRDEARQYLSPLFQHQRGLLRMIARQNEIGEVEIDEERLERLVEERAREIDMERLEPIFREVYGTDDVEAEDGPDNRPSPDKQEETQL